MPNTDEKLTARQRTIKVRTLQLEAFIRWHHRLPSRFTSDAVERALGTWAYNHCRTKNPSPRVLELVQGAGGYGQNRGGRDVTEKRLAELEAFIAEHGRLPRKSRTDKKQEALRQWAHQQVTRCVHPGPRVVALIEAHGGYPKRRDSRHLDRSDELVQFVQAHGRLPVHTMRGYEETFYQWIYRSKRLGHLSAETLRLVEQYEVPKTRNGRRLTELEQFRAAHGRDPARSEDYVEASLHAWKQAHPHLVRRDPYTLGRIEFRARQLAHERALPVVCALNEFLAVHGRLPRNIAGPEGRLMARVYTNTRATYPHPGLLRMVTDHGGLSHATAA